MMNPAALPRRHAPPPAQADFRTCPGDFRVDEVLGFEPSGEGEHCFVLVEKEGRNTGDVAAHLAGRTGLRKRRVSHSGLKDRDAITRQWFSLHLPGRDSPAPEELSGEGLRILTVTRNLRKLRRGAHRGNRFRIRLRNVDGDEASLEDRWRAIERLGVPNYFGEQRFGRDAGNVEQARRMFAGQQTVHDRLLRGILISAARAALFNACLGARVDEGTWETVLSGEVFGFPDNRSLILPHRRRGDEEERFERGEIELTGALWGAGEPLSEGVVRACEKASAGRWPDLAAGLSSLGLRQERRVLRLRPLHPEFRREGRDLLLSFELPRGAFATAVLRELADLRKPGFTGRPPGPR